MNNDIILNRYRELRVIRSKLEKKLTLVSIYAILMTILCIVLLVNVLPGSNIINVDAVEVEVEPVQTETLISEEYIATAYCDCVKCCGKTDGITKSGTKATQGRTIAVDPNKIPLGSKVIIEGDSHEYIAEDIGSAIKGNRVDIFFENHSDAIKFGRRNVNLTVIEDN